MMPSPTSVVRPEPHAHKPLSCLVPRTPPALHVVLCSSFGDFVAVSEVVDVSTAELLKIEVSDGIIAAGFEPEALEILRAKKGGKYIVLQADRDYEPDLEEQRTVFGTSFRQCRESSTAHPAKTPTPLSLPILLILYISIFPPQPTLAATTLLRIPWPNPHQTQ